MTSEPSIWAFVTLLLLTLLSAFFSSTEVALFSLPMSKVRSWHSSAQGRQKALFQILKEPRRFLVLVFMLNTIANVLLQNISSDIFDTPGVDLLGKILVPLVIILVFGELLPKWLGMTYNYQLASLSSRMYLLLLRLFAPLQSGLTWVAELLSRCIFFFLRPEPAVSREALEDIMQHAIQDGVLQDHEVQLVSRWLDVDTKLVGELILPRSEIPIFCSATATQLKNDVQHFFSLEQKKSYQFQGIFIGRSSDIPDGFVLFSQLSRLQGREALKGGTLFHRQIWYVPDSMRVSVLLQGLRQKPSTAVCVVDEHGTALGYLDLTRLEGLFFKKSFTLRGSSGNEELQVMSPTSVIALGSAPLSAVNDFFSVQLKSPYKAMTVAGWIIEQLDTIPGAGMRLTYGPLTLRIIASNPKRIEKVLIQKNPTDIGWTA